MSVARPNHYADGAKSLPKTIEGATARYLYSYATKFRGDEIDKGRLQSYAEAKILALRKKAPVFYEEKLPKLVNQAASNLLIIDTSSHSGLVKFNDTHAQFLRVLDELRKTQPAGNVDFQVELDRAKHKDKLRKEHLMLRDKVDRLEAIEFSNEELGDEDPNSNYLKTLEELDRCKNELMRVANLLVRVEGESIEDELQFKMEITKDSMLERLTNEQLAQLEYLIEQFYIDNKMVRKAIYTNMPNQTTHIEKIIAQLKLNPTEFSQEDLNRLAKDTLEAYAAFFRQRENKKRMEYHESLLRNNHLRPKEGVILDDPEDIPEEVQEKLRRSEVTSRRTFEEIIEKYAPQGVDEDVGNEATGDVVESSDEEPEDDFVRDNGWLFARVKEEPRDDYDDDAPSEDEMIVDERLAQELEPDIGPDAISEAPAQPQILAIQNTQPTPSPSNSRSSSPSTEQPMSIGLLTQPPQPKPSTQNEVPKDEELQMLGTVEPWAKKVIDVITISDDDD